MFSFSYLARSSLFLVGFSLVILSGCVRVDQPPSGATLSRQGAVALEEFFASNRNLPEVVREEEKLEIPKIPEVLRQVSHFTKKDRKFVEIGLARLREYADYIRPEFETRGLPIDLVNVAFAESGFDPGARSGAGAVGLWQFMPATARAYGLDVGLLRDERLHPLKSTTAAAEHLKDLYDEFADWPLALAAYNAGSGRIRRSIKKTGSRDFFVIARSGVLKKETIDYVPKVLALTHITRNLRGYGFLPDNPLLREQ